MATIYNSDLTKELQQGGKTQIRDRIPSELAEKVVPVMEVNPKLLRRCKVVKFLTGLNNSGGTIYTPNANKKLYIVSAYLSWQKDVAATLTEIALRGTIDGVSNTKILSLSGLTTTIDSKSLSIAFPFPIEISQGGLVSLGTTGGVAAGNVVWSVGFTGYEDELINA